MREKEREINREKRKGTKEGVREKWRKRKNEREREGNCIEKRGRRRERAGRKRICSNTYICTLYYLYYTVMYIFTCRLILLHVP